MLGVVPNMMVSKINLRLQKKWRHFGYQYPFVKFLGKSASEQNLSKCKLDPNFETLKTSDPNFGDVWFERFCDEKIPKDSFSSQRFTVVFSKPWEVHGFTLHFNGVVDPGGLGNNPKVEKYWDLEGLPEDFTFTTRTSE